MQSIPTVIFVRTVRTKVCGGKRRYPLKEEEAVKDQDRHEASDRADALEVVRVAGVLVGAWSSGRVFVPAEELLERGGT